MTDATPRATVTIDPRRQKALQALRGLAALTVVLHHTLRILTTDRPVRFVGETLLNAHAAVVIFFVLSGYVLTLSLVKRGLGVGAVLEFYVRRGFRIYPALWVAVSLGLLYVIWLRPLAAPHMATWTTFHYRPEQFGVRPTLLTYFGLDTYLLPTLWTIQVELAGSLVLPFVALLLARVRWSAVPLLLALAALGFVAGTMLRLIPLYMVDFALGAVLATRADPARWHPRAIGAAMALAVLLFFRALHPWDYHAALPALVEGLAATVVIAALVNGVAEWMAHGMLVKLGDWSYSIYLIHLPLAYAIARSLDHAGAFGLPAPAVSVVVALATVLVTVPLSALLYEIVEKPGIAVGKALLARGARRADVLAIDTAAGTTS